jgi:prophage regulatory protein
MAVRGADGRAVPREFADSAATADHILRAPEVRARVGLSRTSIWRAVRRGDFPAPCRLGPNAVGWRASAIEAWIASRAPTNDFSRHQTNFTAGSPATRRGPIGGAR